MCLWLKALPGLNRPSSQTRHLITLWLYPLSFTREEPGSQPGLRGWFTPSTPATERCCPRPPMTAREGGGQAAGRRLPVFLACTFPLVSEIRLTNNDTIQILPTSWPNTKEKVRDVQRPFRPCGKTPKPTFDNGKSRNCFI